MGPTASSPDNRPDSGHAESGVVWASVIAILFAVVAAVSFAVDQSVTLSGTSPAPPQHRTGR